MLKYTKAQLEKIVFTQFDQLNALQEYVELVKERNELLEKQNRQLKLEVSGKKEKMVKYGR